MSAGTVHDRRALGDLVLRAQSRRNPRNRRAIRAGWGQIDELATAYCRAYLPTSPEQRAAGVDNAVNTHAIRFARARRVGA